MGQRPFVVVAVGDGSGCMTRQGPVTVLAVPSV
jgi:hypothetical protein